MGYKVLVDELTVLQTLNKLVQPDGSVVYQNGLGQVYYRDEVVPDDKVAEDWKAALEEGEGPLATALSEKLEQVGDDESKDVAKRLGIPFEGFDDMEEDDVLAAMRNLPSPAISRIKEYEAQRDEPRERIANYNIGFGESPDDRQESKVGGDYQEGDEDKAVTRLTTREVPEDGPVEAGEGITGTGEPAVAYGSKKGDDESPKPTRRGRRDRQPKPSSESTSPGASSTE